MRTLTFALALTFAGCAHSPPEPDATAKETAVEQTPPPSEPVKEAVVEPVKEAAVEPVVAAVEPAAIDAGTASEVSRKPPSNQEAVKSPAPDAGVAPKAVTVAAKPPAAKDAGVASKDTAVVAKPPAARDAGVVAATKEPVVVAAGPVAAPDKKTERLWKSKCSACHGMDGKGATEKGKKMLVSDFTSAAWQSSRTNAELRKGIVDGVKATKNGVKQEMDPYGPELEPAQVTALLGYVRWAGAPR